VGPEWVRLYQEQVSEPSELLVAHKTSLLRLGRIKKGVPVVESNIGAVEKRLWASADQLRANSEFASNEYFLPVMGLIFLRHAYSRYLAVKCGSASKAEPCQLWQMN